MRQNQMFPDPVGTSHLCQDRPVIQSTRLEPLIILKTSKALGITIPPSILIRADEVIE